MTPREVAEMLQVSVAWVQKHCFTSEPFLPFIELGTDESSFRRFLRSEVLNFIDERRTQVVGPDTEVSDAEQEPE